MSPDDAVSRRLEELLARPYARFFGVDLVSAEAGAVTLALAHRREFEHAPGYFEGTITSAIGQLAASYSGALASAHDWVHVTLEQSIHFLGPARGTRLIAQGRVIRAGRSISFAGSEIFVERDGDRQVCARLTLTMRHSPPSPSYSRRC